ncbi:MAG: hypothetical protein K6E73_05135 [Bacteroidales bacterium]|jgi:hypothetical protein|nr:hypothetical protein [Bacteroidales bacterium]MCR5361376.1 hypothetical protein [Bacteroidales bacterium]
MSIFSKFFGNDTVDANKPSVENESENEKEYPTVREQDFIDSTPPTSESNEHIVTFDYGCGYPIDALFIYIERDWRQQGLQDAIANADIHFMNIQVDIIKEGLRRRFDMTRLKYKSLISDLENEIENLTQMGLIALISAVNTKVSLYKEHIAKIEEMENQLKNEEPALMSMIESYKLGFKMGVAQKIGNMTSDGKK